MAGQRHVPAALPPGKRPVPILRKFISSNFKNKELFLSQASLTGCFCDEDNFFCEAGISFLYLRVFLKPLLKKYKNCALWMPGECVQV